MSRASLADTVNFAWQLVRRRGNAAEAVLEHLKTRGRATARFVLGPYRLLVTADPALAREILVEGHARYLKTAWEERELEPSGSFPKAKMAILTRPRSAFKLKLRGFRSAA